KTGQSQGTLQLRNQLRWSSMDNKHSFAVSSAVMRSTDHRDPAGNLLGTFSFQSIEDFAAGRASSFSRTLTPREQNSSNVTAEVGATDQWRPNPDLTVTFGLSTATTYFPARPEYNPAVETAFQVRNDFVPHEWAFTPRISFRKTLGTLQQVTAFDGAIRPPRWTISGAVGLTSQRINTGVV